MMSLQYLENHPEISQKMSKFVEDWKKKTEVIIFKVGQKDE